MALRRSDLMIPDQAVEPVPNNQPDKSNLPIHVAIIMDGNGRWASLRGLSRIAGHEAGGEAVRRTVEAAVKLGLNCLTLYAFSSENWKRSRLEIRALMDLLVNYLRREIGTLREQNVRFRMIGAPEGLNISVLEQIRRAEIATLNNSGMRLSIALNYGSRAEIVSATRRVAQLVLEGKLTAEQIDEQTISDRLFTHSLPDPDLLVRTGGELRLSNFMLWQSAYAELYVTETLWPDFGEEGLVHALVAYQKRIRRFGGLWPNTHLKNAPGDTPAVNPDGRLPAYSHPR